MATDRLRYDKMVEDALRGVVRKALREAADKGLPGDHHFYVTFDTTHDGAELPDWLRSQYPEQMTIVLQHQFWGLDVEEDRFSVTLSFNNRQERLTVPFAAIASFADPAVKFGLQFETGTGEEERPKSVGKIAPPPPAAAKPAAAPAPSPNGADVVTLDAFRKK
jgi:hypothetical protein